MTVHKLSAGDGYTYLTRQVASADERRAAGQSLAEYYVARGNPAGVWMGKGAERLGVAGTEVTEAQMRALFGRGLHPDGTHKLGAAYPNYADLAPYADRLAARVEEFTVLNGRPPSAAERNQFAATEARRGRRAVAGFDLVFTPVKSASVLWGLGDPAIRQAVEDAHHEAVANAVAWVEEHAAFTRTGRGGVAQIEATGLVCAAFDHRESRAGDPDLHTHVAVANKVCGVDGKWRSLDARGLYALGVAASERYNTRFEDALARRLGVRITERPADGSAGRGKRPVREIDGVPAELVGHFSRRRAAIEHRYAELAAEYRRAHGREPGRATQLQLAQRATLETREAKTAGRTLAEMVADWTAQARAVLGRHDVRGLLRSQTLGVPVFDTLEDHAALELAVEVVSTVAEQRSTWTVWNVWAETERALRPLRFATEEAREAATRVVVEAATGPALSIRISEPELVTEAPALVRAGDGQSVFVPHGSARYTTSAVLLAEDSLVAAARTVDGPHLEPVVLDAALAIHEASTGLRLDPGQRGLVEAFALSPARVAVGIGPAGAGKTTAMQAFAHSWATASPHVAGRGAGSGAGSGAGTGGGRVVPLATSAKAAQVLGAELGARAENLHKFLYENNLNQAGAGSADPWFTLRPGDVVLVDEAGMAGTLQLADLVEKATAAGAAVRLLGDPAQLAAVDAGGALSLLESEVGATYLTDLHRFTDPAEGHATLGLRSGDPDALRFYNDRDRIRAGSREAMLEDAYDAWAADVRTGHVSVLIAATRADVVALNARARLERVLAGQVQQAGIELGDGNTAGVGDWVVTRANARTLRYSGHRRRRHGRWVHNGDTWQVTRTHGDGSVTVKHLHNRGTIRLPAGYVADSLELAYASTAHRAQGTTTDTAHALVTAEVTREALYVASTRGRTATTWYVATEPAVDLDCEAEPESPSTPVEVLTAVLSRTGAEASATATIRTTQQEATSLPALVARYDHARDLAARDALRHAVDQAFADRPATERARIVGGRGAGHLATVLADAVARGAHPVRLLRAAHDLDDLAGVRDPALVLASRIDDHPTTLGMPAQPAPGRPLPWLPAPDVGHPGWAPYLEARARLIEDRLAELGGLEAAYREHYAIATPAGLGIEPEPGTRQATAYRAAAAELEHTAPPRPLGARRRPEAAVPPASLRSPSPSQRGPGLSR